jgi:hypothetical protein
MGKRGRAWIRRDFSCDIVVRAIADSKHPAATLAGQCCSEEPHAVDAPPCGADAVAWLDAVWTTTAETHRMPAP